MAPGSMYSCPLHSIPTRLLRVAQALWVSKPLESWGHCLARNVNPTTSQGARGSQASHGFLEPTCLCTVTLGGAWGTAGTAGGGLSQLIRGKALPTGPGNMPLKGLPICDRCKRALEASSPFPTSCNPERPGHQHTKARRQKESIQPPVCKRSSAGCPWGQQGC